MKTKQRKSLLTVKQVWKSDLNYHLMSRTIEKDTISVGEKVGE